MTHATDLAGPWTADPSSLPADLATQFRGVMGWGGVAVWDDDVDVVDLTRAFAARVTAECCGQCFPCRIGMREASEILDEIAEGRGMAAVGIPDYRLPRQVLRAEVARVETLGVEIRHNQRFGVDVSFDDLFSRGYEAVLVAVGAHQSARMGCEGEDAGYDGFMPGVKFLRDVAFGRTPLTGKTMLVIGGGNVAMDCVRTARRLGFDDVRLLYRRTEAEMPADGVEIAEAKEEGVAFHTLVAPVRIIAEDGRVAGLECRRMELGEPDSSGRRRLEPVEGSEFVMECDAIVPAIGQVCSVDELVPETVAVSKWKTLEVDPMTMQSADPRVFGGGDCYTGPSSLVAV